jgi:hypothetical protein
LSASRSGGSGGGIVEAGIALEGGTW